MSDPVRRLDDANRPDAEQRLLHAGLDMEPPPGADARVWAGLVASLGVGLGTGGAVSAGAATTGGVASGAGAATTGGASSAVVAAPVAATAVKTAGLGVVAKAAIVGAVATAAVGGGIWATNAFGPGAATPGEAILAPLEPARAAAPPPILSDHPVVEAPMEPLVAAPAGSEGSARRRPEVRARTRAAFVEPRAASPSEASRLREESALLAQAREALRVGDAAAARRLVDVATVRFPSGALVQEREAIAIEALWRDGQRAAARDRAAAFLRAYPRSPHAAKVRAFADAR